MSTAAPCTVARCPPWTPSPSDSRPPTSGGSTSEGPTVAANGLALCCLLHHRLLDQGVLGITNEHTIAGVGALRGRHDLRPVRLLTARKGYCRSVGRISGDRSPPHRLAHRAGVQSAGSTGPSPIDATAVGRGRPDAPRRRSSPLDILRT